MISLITKKTILGLYVTTIFCLAFSNSGLSRLPVAFAQVEETPTPIEQADSAQLDDTSTLEASIDITPSDVAETPQPSELTPSPEPTATPSPTMTINDHLRNKIAPSILTALEDDPIKKLPVIIYMAEQATLDDHMRITGDAEYDLAQQRQRITEQLKNTATSTQATVYALLVSLGIPSEQIQSFWVFNGLAVTLNLDAILQVAALPEVAHIYADIQGKLPADQGGLVPDSGDASILALESNIAQINADDVWAIGITGQGIVIGSIDSGVQWGHPALKDRYRGWNGSTATHTYSWYDAVNGETTPYDDYNYGTHAMGIMAGGEGTSHQIGVAPGAKWITAKAIRSDGTWQYSQVLMAMQWMLAPGGQSFRAPDVVLGAWEDDCSGSNAEIFRTIIWSYRAARIIPIFGNGDTGVTVKSPACYPESFAVAAVNASDEIQSATNGPSPYNEIKPEVSAPGYNINSSIPTDAYSVRSGSSTTAAAAHVAGVVALLLQVNPYLSVDEIEDYLTSTAVDLGATGRDNVYGYGRVDALAAVNAVRLDLAMGSGTHDDTSEYIVYTGGWSTIRTSGPYNSTLHYSSVPNSTAGFSFNGQVFKLVYTGATNRGVMTVQIDAQPPITLNQYTSTLQWQKVWTSPTLSDGIHTVTLTHTSGSYVDVDAIIITQPPQPLIVGTYDDTNVNINYSASGWLTYSGTGPYSNTLRYSNAVGSTATFSFTGSGLQLGYAKSRYYGKMTIQIDGGAIIELNQYTTATTTQWQQIWTSDPLADTTHTVTLTHLTGSYVTLDKIVVQGTPVPSQAGIYDDMSGAINYSASGWLTYSGAGPYSNTLHYSNTIGSTASILFSGVGVKLVYTGANNRGTMTIQIDSLPPVTLNQYSATLQWQSQWSSETLSDGVHTLTLSHTSGAYVDIDAIIVKGSPLALTPGLYDDTDQHLEYNGSGWNQIAISNAYNGTFHYSTRVGNTVTTTFNGSGISLLYLAHPSYGVMTVQIDSMAPVALNQNATIAQWQAQWSSDLLSDGEHTLTLTHASGAYVGLDGVLVSSPVGVGTYDDNNERIIYTGSWYKRNLSGNYSRTEHYSTVLGSSARLVFSGSKVVTVFYRKNVVHGIANISIDGRLVGTINQYSLTEQQQQQWSSGVLGDGMHTLTISHASGANITLDAIMISNSTALGTGQYDDTNGNILYGAGWNSISTSGPYNSTFHYSSSTGSTAQFSFTGRGIRLTYLAHPLYGVMAVQIDSDPPVLLNQYSSSVLWQREWASDLLSDGTHTVTLTHQSGAYIGLDGITVAGAFNTGLHDDNSVNILYGGVGWTSISLAGNYNNTEHYSNTSGSIARFAFSGSALTLLSRKYPGFGNMTIQIDSDPPQTFNQNASSQMQQQQWSSGILADTEHYVTMTHTDGTYITLDGIWVSQPLSPDVYDDTNINILYNGWAQQTSSGSYNNTEHYSTTIGSTARFTFIGSGVLTLGYSKNTNHGVLNVSIDGGPLTPINQYATSQLTQQQWSRGVYGSGIHTVVLTHASGVRVTLDKITISNPSALSIGTHDDTNENVLYSGGWSNYTISGPYLNTMKLSSTTGNVATFTFSGRGVVLKYLAHPSYGTMTIQVDSQTPVTLNQYSPLIEWQKVWSSGVLNDGLHTLTLTHAGGTYTNIDAITVIGPLNTGKFDDTNANILYDAWKLTPLVGAFGNTLHYSDVSNQSARAVFNGRGISIIYSKNPSYGSMNVQIDSQTPVLVDQYATTSQNQRVWSSDILTSGEHTLNITHATGRYVSLDGLQIIDALGVGKYDDRDLNILYNGIWNDTTNPSAYQTTFRYSTQPQTPTQDGSTAKLVFSGRLVQLTYFKGPNYGNMRFQIDSSTPITIDQSAPTAQWGWGHISDLLSSGEHQLTLTHLDGVYAGFDAITIANALGAGTYQETDQNILYQGQWSYYAGPPETLIYAKGINNKVKLAFSGTQVSVGYCKHSSYGDMTVEILSESGISEQTYTISQTGESSSLTCDSTSIWNSILLTNGIHLITLAPQSDDKNVTIDKIIVTSP